MHFTKIAIKPSIFIVFAFAIISFFHIWKISDVPKGFFGDELSIGYNASLIAETGYDEHKRFLPVYFEAFGEYKNPLYIYAVALIFKLFGVSEFCLRITSSIFFLFFLLGLYLLIAGIFRDNKTISIYALFSAGFLPWFFTLSRISFEVISQLTMLTYSLFFIYRVYHLRQGEKGRLDPILAGVFLGLSVYSYSTARLLSFLMFISLMILYLRKSTFKKTAVLSGSFFLLVVPYIVFSMNNPGSLTTRFRTISYIYDPSITLLQKIFIFVYRYISYFGLDFLLLKGDLNLRHATGYGGELSIAVFLLSIIGLIWIVIQKKLFRDKFLLFMFINMLLSPVAAALMQEGIGPTHALRSILLGFYILFYSCYGLLFFFSIKNNLQKYLLASVAFASLFFQTCLYVNDYFTRYREISISWFKTYDFKNSLIAALEQKPQVIISPDSNQSYLLIAFYNKLLSNPQHIPIYVSDVIPQVKTCIIYFEDELIIPDIYSARFHDSSLHGSLAKLICD